MIDWGATKWGLVADDIGCWTLHLGRLHHDYARIASEFIVAYRDTAPLTDREARAVPLFQRLRLATRPPYVQDQSVLRGIKRWIDEWLEAVVST